MKAAKYLFIFIVIFLFSISVDGKMLTADSIAERIMYQVWSFPQEKLHVVTDREAYVAGDTIRFRAFLVDASSHRKPEYSSKFVYLELIDPFGTVVERVKIKSNDSAFAGVLPLSEELPEGNYTLSAYTQFMRNSGEEYFFKVSMPVLSQLSNKYKIETSVADGNLSLRLLNRLTDTPVRAEHISVSGPSGRMYSPDVKKRSSYTLPINRSMSDEGVLKVKFDKYEKYISVPYNTAPLSLTFHPEGGTLIAGVKNRLYFKGLDTKGASADFSGVVADDQGNIVDSISPAHSGMGMIEFVPLLGRSYSAKIKDMSFTIAEASDVATSLRVSAAGKDSIDIHINGRNSGQMSLVAHNGGIVTLAKDISGMRDIVVERALLGEGIVQFLLVDSEGNILSSRMIFNRRGYIYACDADSLPYGDYAVRVRRDIPHDGAPSIVASLMLKSELGGYVEDPDYYFTAPDSIADSHLDLLLSTQGWERYDLASSLKGEMSSPEMPLEIGGVISGTVRSRWRSKPLADAVVMLMAPTTGFGAQAITDSEGRFVFDGFDWAEGTGFIIQAFGDSGSKEHNFTIDEESYPVQVPIRLPGGALLPEEAVDVRALSSGTILLDEIEVTAPKSLEESHREMLASLGVRSFTSEDIDRLKATSYDEIIRKIPGLRIVDGNVISMYARGTYNTGIGGTPVEIWIDGVRWTPTYSHASGGFAPARQQQPIGDEMTRHEHTYVETMNNTLLEFASSYPFHSIKSIEYYRPSVALIISMSAAYGGGALLFTTKDASDFKDTDKNLFIREIKPLGHQNSREAYKPHYVYDPTESDGTFRAAWFPIVSDIQSLPPLEDFNVVIEGIADGFMPVTVRIKKAV